MGGISSCASECGTRARPAAPGSLWIIKKNKFLGLFLEVLTRSWGNHGDSIFPASPEPLLCSQLLGRGDAGPPSLCPFGEGHSVKHLGLRSSSLGSLPRRTFRRPVWVPILMAPSPQMALPTTMLSDGLLALAELSQNPSFHRDHNGPQPPTAEHKGTATHLEGDRRDEGTPVGRLGTFMQQGLDLWV